MKVSVGAASGAAVTVLVFIVNAFGYDLPDTVATATVTLAAFVAAWLTPHTRRPDLGEEA
ncbi:hypothetical protein [Nocardiopsis synnemataformans]|uniref:hypothetical protein n=1 Tax=Nocardiopsis synnemataformans TaxID=61305 RepID=UPI003EBD966C